jgi:hypothetical protein
VEHPIPESLGNDDLALEPGFVCDPCNQYFGSKVEQKIMSLPPFGVERVCVDVPTKKGKPAVFHDPVGLTLYPSGYLDRMLMVAAPAYYLGKAAFNFPYFIGFPTPREDFYTVRFLLKVGLELLLSSTEEIDPYDPKFNPARQFSRYSSGSATWEMAYGHYPKKQDLIISERVDEYGPLTTHQLYQYELGQMLSRDIGFCFVYRTHIFACNLSGPSILEYMTGFNNRNTV